MVRSILLVSTLVFAAGVSAEDKADAEAEVDSGMHPRVKMETTLGDITLELDAEKSPITVENFVRYAQDGFYNDTIFHRVIKTFMIQGGGFYQTMEKNDGLRPGIKNEWQNGLKNVRGTISMARSGGRPNSATAQFFINVVDNAALDRPQRDGAGYAVFGKVVDGLDVVDKIRDVKVSPHPNNPGAGQNAPVEPVIIKSVTVISKYDAQKVAAQIEALEKEAKDAKAKVQAEQEKQMQDFITKTEADTGKEFAKTESGLMSIILTEGDGPSPQPTDTVEVHYTGWLLDGTKFDSSVDRGAPATFPLNRVIAGWTEGVGLMKVGEKRKLLIPYDLGYGERGSPPRIPPKAALVFDVELLSIK